MMEKVKAAWRERTQGCNGPDQLGLAATMAGVAAGVLEMLFSGGVFLLIQLALFGYACWRMGSKNISRRRDENAKYLYLVMPGVTAAKRFCRRFGANRKN